MIEQTLQEMAVKFSANMGEKTSKVFQDEIEALKVSQLKQNALKVGDKVENFTLKNIKGEDVNLKDLITKNYLVIDFYRGGWCPYCMVELKEYENLKSQFEQAGANIVGINPQVVKYTADAKEQNSITFELLSDENAKVMKSFGIVFEMNEDAKAVIAGFGMDMTDLNGNDNFELPVPATYVIDKNLEVVFSFVEEDYKKRCEPNDVLDFIKNQEN